MILKVKDGQRHNTNVFAKIFDQIFDSSIAEDPSVRHGFMDLLILADAEGVVDMTAEAIARRTNVPVASVCTYLKALESPDPRSRSKRADGCRIKKIDSHRDWGWQIVNYSHYRELKDEEARKKYFRDKQRESRARKRSSNAVKDNQTESKKITHAEEEEEGSSTHTPRAREAVEIPDRSAAVAQTAAAGIDPTFAGHVYDDWSGRDGKDAAGQPRRWLQYVTTRWQRERASWKDGTHKGKQHGTNRTDSLKTTDRNFGLKLDPGKAARVMARKRAEQAAEAPARDGVATPLAGHGDGAS